MRTLIEQKQEAQKRENPTTVEEAADALRWARHSINGMKPTEKAATALLKASIPVGATAFGWTHSQCFKTQLKPNLPEEVAAQIADLEQRLAFMLQANSERVPSYTQIVE